MTKGACLLALAYANAASTGLWAYLAATRSSALLAVLTGVFAVNAAFLTGASLMTPSDR